ncbi:glycoside hydrolase family 13 protein [Mycena albidolilacea]|uniref:alpha-amylase n=1 Tax=Mycena albidolilacea TaxID=1033008 RepID=A0AAD7A597_9AGAR|nr:glycoside hydrolase family 13 protein [Mycena albidolilacea]
MLPSLVLVSLLASFQPAFAATAEQWRTRSIYQIIVDRFALEPGAVVNECVLSEQTWCGGTWKGILKKLDYIQSAGFTAIWISPVNQNYQGPKSAYGDPYHGYWSADISQLNDKFGTADDLKALSAEVHRRNMYLMVDVVVNNVMATSLTPDYSTYMFKDAKYYHPYCAVDFSNITSEQQCWLGDTKVPLPDLNTENSEVIAKYSDWISDLVQTYSIDGLRIDAAKHVRKAFWPAFAKSAGVFCMGEVFDPLVPYATDFQGSDALDSVLNYPLYYALVAAFTLPGAQNMSALIDNFDQSKTGYSDTTVLGNFLENQDLPRWHNLSVDPQSLYNAMTVTFLTEGIPIVYYGQEQGFSGAADPYNREPLWPSNYTNTTSYQLMTTLNQLRTYMINTTDWATQKTNVITTNQNGIALQKGEVVSILTNIGAPPQNFTYTALKSPWPQGTVTIDVVGCRQFVVASGGYLEVEYTKGGVPVVLAQPSSLNGSGLCGSTMEALHANTLPGQTVAQSSALDRAVVPSLIALLLMAASLGLW